MDILYFIPSSTRDSDDRKNVLVLDLPRHLVLQGTPYSGKDLGLDTEYIPQYIGTIWVMHPAMPCVHCCFT